MTPKRWFVAGAVSLALAAVWSAGCGPTSADLGAVKTALDAEKAARADEAKRRDALEKKLAAVEAEKAALATDKAGLEADAAERAARIEVLEKEIESLRAALGMSSAELEAVKAKASELEKKTSEFEELTAALKDEIAAGAVELLGSKIRMKDKILFKSGSAKLNKAGKKALKSIAGVFVKLGKAKIFQITGHTDTDGKPEDNWELSTERALTVLLFLTESGVPPELLTAAGFGEYHPVCPKNDTPKCKAANRRIDIILLPNIDLAGAAGKGAKPPPK